MKRPMLRAHGASRQKLLIFRLGTLSGAPNQVVDPEQDESSDERHEEAGRLVGLIVTDEAAEIGPQK